MIASQVWMSGQRKENISRLSRVIERMEITPETLTTVDAIIMPVNQAEHWSLLIALPKTARWTLSNASDHSGEVAMFLDSLFGSVQPNAGSKWEFFKVRYPASKDVVSCRVVVLYMALLYAATGDSKTCARSFVEEEWRAMRTLILLILKRQEVTKEIL